MSHAQDRGGGIPVVGSASCTCEAFGRRQSTLGTGPGRGGRGDAAGGGHVDAGGVLGTARVVLATSLGTGVILSAVLYALVAPFLANIEGDRLRVLGDVGADVVGAYAVVGQNVRITSVVNWLLRVGDAGKLKADERALFLLIGAPLLA